MPVNVDDGGFMLGPIPIGENQEIAVETIAATLNGVSIFEINFAAWILLSIHEFTMLSQDELSR